MKNSAAAIRNNPKLSSKNDDHADFHRSEIDCRGAHLGGSSGDVSSWMSTPSGGDSNPDDNDAGRATELNNGPTVVMIEGVGGTIIESR